VKRWALMIATVRDENVHRWTQNFVADLTAIDR